MTSESNRRKRFSSAEREAVYKKMGGHCAYCGQEITLHEMQIDHVIPIKQSGLNTMDNLLPACRSCNHYKHTMPVERFRAMLERELEILEKNSVAYRNAVRFGLVIPAPHKIVFFFEKEAPHG